jgi:hypothetical protein
VIDFYLQFCTPAFLGSWRLWLYSLSIQSIYGHPRDPSKTLPRMLHVVHLRLLGVQFGTSITYNCAPRDVNAAPNQQ